MNYRQLFLTIVFSVMAAVSLYPEGALSRPLASLSAGDALRLAAAALLGIVALYCFAVGIYMRIERKYWRSVEAQIQKSNSERKEKYRLRATNR